jgi:hypothetical protein
MKSKLLFLFCLLFNALSIFGQDNLKTITSEPETYKAMTYSLGYSHFRIQDIQVSPFVYKSHNIPLKIGYLKQKEESLFSVDFFLTLGNLSNKTFPDRTFYMDATDNNGVISKDEYEMAGFPIIQEGINISYLKKTDLIKDSRYSLYLGAGINQYFMLSFTVVPIFVISEVSLSPKAYLSYKLNETSRLSASLSFPLAGIMSRLPYSNDPADGKHSSFISVYTTGTKFAQPGNYQKIDFLLSYSKNLNERWEMSYVYGFQWLHYSPNRGVKAYNNQLSIQFNRKFKTK